MPLTGIDAEDALARSTLRRTRSFLHHGRGAMTTSAIAFRRSSTLLQKFLSSTRSFSSSLRSSFAAAFGSREDGSAAPRFGSDRATADFISDVLDQTRAEVKHDIVHMLIMRNNSFVTVTDSKGNKKTGTSAGALETGTTSRYSCDSAAEHVARTAVNLGPAVIKVKGYSTFKKKKDAILSWKEGAPYGNKNRILQIHDVTQLAHNGCRRRKQRRI